MTPENRPTALLGPLAGMYGYTVSPTRFVGYCVKTLTTNFFCDMLSLPAALQASKRERFHHMTTYHLEARATRNTPRHAVYVIYGRDWEVCEGTHGLMHVECEELAMAWARDDRLAMRDHGAHRCRAPHEYRIVADLAPDPDAD